MRKRIALIRRPRILHFPPGRQIIFILKYLVNTSLGILLGLLLETLVGIFPNILLGF
jgi:hypothetical protein